MDGVINKEVFTQLKEPQLYHYYEPEPGLFIAESLKVAQRALNAGYQPVAVLADRQKADREFAPFLAACGEIPVFLEPEEELQTMVGYHLTGGLLCAMRRRALPPCRLLLQDARRIAVLEHITNPTNVGAIIRNAAALQVDAVVLTADSSDPLCRRAIRVSMGTVFQVPWTVLGPEEWPDEGMTTLAGMGYARIALALTPGAVGIEQVRDQTHARLAMILGSEGDGLTPQTIASCDAVARIPMRAGVDSLNVAAASAVAFWTLA